MPSLVSIAHRRLLRGPQSARQLAYSLGVSRERAANALRRLSLIGAARNTRPFGTEGVYELVPGAVVSPEGRGASAASRANLVLGPLMVTRAKRGRRQRIGDDIRWPDERIRDRDGYGYGRVALDEVWR